MATKDTVGERYYAPVKYSQNVGFLLFWGSGFLSLMLFVVNSQWFLALSGVAILGTVGTILSIIFPSLVAALFFQGLAHRLYFLPRADSARRANFLSDSYDVNLSDEKTEGYYNNNFEGSTERLAANCMESAFFTNAISTKMLQKTRIWTAIYLVLYLALVISRQTDLKMIEIVAGVLFSEAVFSNWLRSEYIRHKSEDVYDKLRRLFADNASERNTQWKTRAFETTLSYEAAKAVAAVPMSSKQYDLMNKELSEEWGRRRIELGF